MSKNQKAKVAKGIRNDARKNGKASKQDPGKMHTYEKLSDVQRVLLGKGLYTKWNRVIDGRAKGLPGQPINRTNRHNTVL